MPFGKDLAPGMLHAHDAHAQAVARIQWCISEQAIGVISGECGAGKTVAARAAVAGLDASRHTVLYLGTPGVGLRGIYGMIVSRLGGTPKFHHAALIPQVQELLAGEASERGKRVILICDEAHLLDAESLEGIRCLSNLGWIRPPRSACCCSGSRRSVTACGRGRSPRWINESRSATRSGGSPRPRPRATCSTIWRSRASAWGRGRASG
jgi:AAA domain